MDVNLKVLLVEDNPGDARLLQEMLSEAGGDHIALVHVENLSGSIDYLKHEKIDVILLDQSLPDSQGFETFERLYGQFPDVPIVLLTGLDDEKTAHQAVQRGAQEYLVKGRITGDSLVRVIRYSIERNHMLVELKASEARFRDQRDMYARELTKITERFERQMQELSVVRQIGEALKYARDVEKVFEVIIDTILAETNAENCSLMLLNRKTGGLTVKAARGQTDPIGSYYSTPDQTGHTFRVGEGIAGWVAQHGEPLTISDIATGTVARLYPELDAEGSSVPELSQLPEFVSPADPALAIGSLLCLPLVINNEIVGVVNMSHPAPGAFSGEDERLVSLVTDQMSIALNNVQLVEHLSQSLSVSAEQGEVETPTIKVLLIEDNPGDARLLQESLDEHRSISFEVTLVDRLSTGLKHLFKEVFDVILLDLSLPDGQGIESFHRVQDQTSEVPVVVLTGLNDEALAVQAVREGVQDYLIKGQMDGNALIRAIQYAIQRHGLLLKLKELQEQLLEAERLQVLSQTAGAAAHEITQPLTVIVAKADILLATMDPDDPMRSHIESIRDAGDRVANIVIKMRSTRQYATKPYLGENIIDLDASSEEGEGKG